MLLSDVLRFNLHFFILDGEVSVYWEIHNDFFYFRLQRKILLKIVLFFPPSLHFWRTGVCRGTHKDFFFHFWLYLGFFAQFAFFLIWKNWVV